MVGMLYVGNAFSLAMLEWDAKVEVRWIGLEDAKKLVAIAENIKSIIGHESTAQVASALLGVELKTNKEAIKLTENDVLLVFQLMQRLPEGKILSTEEVKNLQFRWAVVVVEKWD